METTHFLKPTKLKRYLFFICGDVCLLFLALVLAFFIRFEFSFPDNFGPLVAVWLPIVLLLKILLLHIFKLYSFTWMFVGIKELVALGNACFLSSAGIYALDMLLYQAQFNSFLPRSVILIDFILTVLFIGNFRVAKRLYQEAFRVHTGGRRALIIGAGPTGERLAREFMRSDDKDYYPVAFVDDDPNKFGVSIHGVKVAGPLRDIPEIIENTNPKTAIIAITTAKHVMVRDLFEVLNENGIKDIKVIPHLSQLPTKSLSVKDIIDIKIEDLLYREMVTTDIASIRSFVQRKNVLVTGAAGSIGSEIVRQALRYHPAKIVVFDIDETEVYNLMLEIKPQARIATEIIPYIGDIRKDYSLKKVFANHKPNVIFHSAAYKHVPMMELFPDEALETNFLGTYNLAKQAVDFDVETFVNISTDKAVNPSSVMGATKRLAEMVCTTFNQSNGTRFVSVRFGNVLGSRGSVVPVFLEQIKKGGPVTVTHPDVERYFMMIPEAVSLVFQAATMGKGGEVFVLDMGKPIKIVKIAEDLIRLNGMDPYSDIKIEFVGLRPGEKMYEELLTAEEGTTSTSHEKIFIARNITKFQEPEITDVTRNIEQLLLNGNMNINEFLRDHVPFYQNTQ